MNATGLRAGDRFEMVVVDNLTRTQIVQYAGASGDFNPLHTDEVYATLVAGQPTVMAHGMFTMGVTARALTEWFGPGQLLRFGARFAGPVWPGDTLTVTAVISAVHADPEPSAEVELHTAAAPDRVVLTGTALIRLPPAR